MVNRPTGDLALSWSGGKDSALALWVLPGSTASFPVR